MKNVFELIEEVQTVVSEKFHKQYPEIFVKPNARNQEDYDNAVEGYKLYVAYINAISKLHKMRDYRIEGIDFYNNNHDGEKLIEDVKNCEDILKFCFFNIPLI